MDNYISWFTEYNGQTDMWEYGYGCGDHSNVYEGNGYGVSSFNTLTGNGWGCLSIYSHYEKIYSKPDICKR